MDALKVWSRSYYDLVWQKTCFTDRQGIHEFINKSYFSDRLSLLFTERKKDTGNKCVLVARLIMLLLRTD